MLAHEHPGRTGVVEVDVAEQEVADVGESQPLLREPGLQGLDRRGGAAVEEREAVVGVEEIRADRPLVALMQEVEQLHL